MEHATRQGRLDALCIRAAEGTLTKQTNRINALFAERDVAPMRSTCYWRSRGELALARSKTTSHWLLRRKCEDETLTDAELQELQSLNHEWEARNVKRVEALCALAEHRGTTLRGVMAELGLKGSHRDF